MIGVHGTSIAAFWKPKYEPRNTGGTEMPDYRTSNANTVVTAASDLGR